MLFIVTGCASATMPPFLVLITPVLPSGDGLCTGAVVSPTEIVTAGHCAKTAMRVVTVNGQEAWVRSAKISTEHDVAVLTVDRVLWVSAFAEFANPALGVDTIIYGYCPYQVGYVARHAFYDGLLTLRVQSGGTWDYGVWILPSIPGMSNKICGGDSGSPLTQNGKVVGILAAVESDVFWVALGSTTYSTPVRYAQELLDE
jgi:hypothetical protein